MRIHVEPSINEERKGKAHKIPEATPLTLCWGKMQLLLYAKHCAKCHLTLSSHRPWEVETFILILQMRRVRLREVKEGVLSHTEHA